MSSSGVTASVYKALMSSVMLLFSLAVRGEESLPVRTPTWPNTFVARVEALAILQTFNADLLSHDSATLTLEHWCDVHRLASPARIVAARVPDVNKPASPEQRRELGVTSTEPIRYRRVKLLCGTVMLSEADNWYVPSRLTSEMNKVLDTSDMPFGKVVLPLHFQRHTLSSTLLWMPLPLGWEMKPNNVSDTGSTLTIPPELLQHRALLTLPDGTPFSEVVETYTANVLAFLAPPP
jgi:hypothetical protein